MLCFYDRLELVACALLQSFSHASHRSGHNSSSPITIVHIFWHLTKHVCCLVKTFSLHFSCVCFLSYMVSLFIACLLFQLSPPCFCTTGGGHTEDDKETEAGMKNVAGKLVI